LLISLTKDIGKLPAGISIQFPHDVGVALIHRGTGVAIPVGSFAATPDLVIDDDDMQHVGFDPWGAETLAAA
jgi:hypothetical protein